MSGKVYRGGSNERMIKITDKNIGDEQNEFRNARECVVQISDLIMTVKYT